MSFGRSAAVFRCGRRASFSFAYTWNCFGSMLCNHTIGMCTNVSKVLELDGFDAQLTGTQKSTTYELAEPCNEASELHDGSHALENLHVCPANFLLRRMQNARQQTL